MTLGKRLSYCGPSAPRCRTSPGPKTCYLPVLHRELLEITKVRSKGLYEVKNVRSETTTSDRGSAVPVVSLLSSMGEGGESPTGISAAPTTC